MDAVRADVIRLIEKELDSANSKFPFFNSSHEGAAVICEELQEAKDCMEQAEKAFQTLWRYVKNNFRCSDNARDLYYVALHLSVEAIQLAAMAQKFIRSNVGEGAYGSDRALESDRRL